MDLNLLSPTVRHGVLVLALAGALGACASKEDGEVISSADEKSAVNLPSGQIRVPKAALQMLDVKNVQQVSALTTAAIPAHVAFADDLISAVPTPVSSRVISVHAHAGDVVKKGDLLAVLQSNDVLHARSEAAVANLAYEAAATEVKRQQYMYERGVGVEMELRAAEAKLREAQQERVRANGASSLLGAGAGDRLEVRSPRAGVVTLRHAVPGGVLEAGTALFMVGDAGALGVTAEAFESDLAQLKSGAAVKVTLPQLARELTGRIRHIGAELDKESRRAAVFVELGEQVEGLRPGMQAKVDVIGQTPNGLTVPVTAVLIKDGNMSVVYVQREPQVFEAKVVKLGQPVRGVVPVLDGLTSEDNIVVRGGLLLDGAASQML